jgi:Domain of unknown function (DUF4070)
LSREDRLVSVVGRESNVRFLRPYEDVVDSWKRCVGEIYEARALFDRLMHQVDATYPNRLDTPVWRRLTPSNLRRGLTIAVNLASGSVCSPSIGGSSGERHGIVSPAARSRASSVLGWSRII